MATRSIDLRDAKTQQYLGWKEQSEDYDIRDRRRMIAQLSYLLDDATLQEVHRTGPQVTTAQRSADLRYVWNEGDVLI